MFTYSSVVYLFISLSSSAVWQRIKWSYCQFEFPQGQSFGNSFDRRLHSWSGLPRTYNNNYYKNLFNCQVCLVLSRFFSSRWAYWKLSINKTTKNQIRHNEIMYTIKFVCSWVSFIIFDVHEVWWLTAAAEFQILSNPSQVLRKSVEEDLNYSSAIIKLILKKKLLQ